MKIETIDIDIETYSSNDLLKCGVYKYVQAPDFDILLFGYSVNGGPIIVIDLAQGQEIPVEILSALSDPSVKKYAHNASFERICLSEYLRRKKPEYFYSYSIDEDTVSDYLDPSSWYCSMIMAAYNGLPLSLAGVGAILGLDEQKMTEGKDLIRYFCVPCKPTKTNGGRTRNLPHHNMDKWTTFVSYNERDVAVEKSIMERLKKYAVPQSVWDEYHLSEEINDRGILIDLQFAKNAIEMDELSKEESDSALKQLTNLPNPNSVSQLKDWLADNGMVVDSLGKKQVTELIKTAPDKLREVLELRQVSAKSSVKKYEAMINSVCADGRVRGMFAFYGASRSGRFAGRIVQLQNLPQNHLIDLDLARSLVANNEYKLLSLMYDSVPQVLSELIRTTFIPKEGYKYVVADFSAIEARVLAWLAGEQWVLDAFANGEDIYCSTASRMFHCKVEKHGENSHLRQRGKQAVLACGYGGSVGAMVSMGAVDLGIPEDELQDIVDMWREANPHIVSLWYAIDRAAKQAIVGRCTTEVRDIRFECRNGMLFIELPSGRHLSYCKPKIGTNRFGSDSITYEGTNGTTKKWDRIETFGGKLTENIVQALARDILCNSMRTLSHTFICAHIHDELVIECSKDVSVDAICEQMGRIPSWAEGLVLRADGYECAYYQKDN